MIYTPPLKAALEGSALVREVDNLPRYLRCETIFLYPDGSSVDVFIGTDEPLLKRYTLSDLGQTMSWLLDMQVKPWQSKHRQQLLEDALRLYKVQHVGGALQLLPLAVEELLSGIASLGQACVRTADLFYTRKLDLQSHFSEEVEEFLAELEVPYETETNVEGRGGRVVKVDFVVRSYHRDSMILTLSPGHSSYQAHVAANEVFSKWYDLGERPEQRVTVYDDRVDTYRTEDLDRLRDKSDLLGISQTQVLNELLVA